MSKEPRIRNGELMKLSPYDIVIIGIDTEHKSLAEHFLWDGNINQTLTEESIDSVRQNGVREPIKVKRDGDRWMGVDGRGRTRRARIVWDEQTAAGVPEESRIKVPALRVQGTDLELMLLSRQLNSGRMESAPYDIGAYANAAMNTYGATMDQMAMAFGISIAVLRNYLALLDLAPEAIEALKAGGIKATHGLVLAELPRDEQRKALADIEAAKKEGNKTTVETLRNRVNQTLGKDPSKTPKNRVGVATDIITKFADSYKKPSDSASKAELLEALNKAVATLDKVSKAVTDKSLVKLADTGD